MGCRQEKLNALCQRIAPVAVKKAVDKSYKKIIYTFGTHLHTNEYSSFCMKKVVILFIITFLAFPKFADAQADRWKRTRYELVGGVGISAFVGELGGKDSERQGHFLNDFDFMSQRFALSAGMRYKILNPLAVKASLTYGMLAGSDKRTANIYREDRNLSFRTNLWELEAQVEYSIIPEPVNYRASRRRKFSLRSTIQKTNIYVFAGLGLFYYNPKAKDTGEEGTGKWVALQPLGTEGQGLMEGRKKYSRIALAFPFGLGVKYPISRSLCAGLEFGPRYTTTDYIDDVSTTYVDNAWLAEKNPQAARMADHSIQTNDDSDPLPYVRYGKGDQRGESKFNDFYMFTMVSVTYKLKTGRNGLPKF